MAASFSTKITEHVDCTINEEMSINGQCTVRDKVTDVPTVPKSDVTCSSLSAQLAGTLKFTNKDGQQVSAFPIIVDFRRLIQLSNKSTTCDSIIPGTTNQELLHAVVGLYDVSLSEMTPDVLYSTVCDKWAKTIILIQDLKETVADLDGRKKRKLENQCDNGSSNTTAADDDKDNVTMDGDNQEDKDVFVLEETSASPFTDIYSDTESDEEDDDDSDEEDFSRGIHQFIKRSSERRARRENSECIQSTDAGIENRIVGCLTFEKKYVKHKEKVTHLTLLTVRRRFRKFGIGRYLITQVLDSSVVGLHDVVVVHADNGAVEFFERSGFTDDVIVNSRWSELAEQFTNCTLMCYLPGFSGLNFLPRNCEKSSSLVDMEKEMKVWKEKSIEAYQAQVTCFMRMGQEILQLHKLAQSQRSFIDDLTSQNEKLRQDRMILGKDLLEKYRTNLKSFWISDHPQIVDGQQVEDGGGRCVSGEGEDNEEEDEVDELSTSQVMRELENRVETLDMMRKMRQLVSTDSLTDEAVYTTTDIHVRSLQEPYDHTKDAAIFYSITEKFKESMKQDQTLTTKYEVTMITKACLTSSAEGNYMLKVPGLVDPSQCEQLYFCGSLERPNTVQNILRDGFSHKDFSHGEFGRGLYFSRYPSKAAHFSAIGSLILAEVAVGKVENVVNKDRIRTSPSHGFDSVLTPGRLSKNEADNANEHLEEFIIFDPTQAIPLCLLTYDGTN